MIIAVPPPNHIGRKQAQHNASARECYGLRNVARGAGDPDLAADYEAVGDTYFGWSLAIATEWEGD